MSNTGLARWHEFAKDSDPDRLDELIADDAVFYSPIVHTPQTGKALVKMYLTAAGVVFFSDSFNYVGEWHSNEGVVLEFETEIDGISVNGIDMIRFNSAGQIMEFKVLIRPLKAVNMVHQKMMAMLEEQNGPA